MFSKGFVPALIDQRRSHGREQAANEEQPKRGAPQRIAFESVLCSIESPFGCSRQAPARLWGLSSLLIAVDMMLFEEKRGIVQRRS